MKFLTGFMVGTISGVAMQLFQAKNSTYSINDNKLFQNIKDFKDILSELQKNSTAVPEVLSGIQHDLTTYVEDIKPDVMELQKSIHDMQQNLDSFHKE